MSSQIPRFVADTHQGADRHGDMHDGLSGPAGSARRAVAGGQPVARVGRRSPATGYAPRHVTAVVVGAERSGEGIDDSVQGMSPVRRQDGRTRIGALYGTVDDRPKLARGLSRSGRDTPEATQPSDLYAFECGSELRPGRHLLPIGVRAIEHAFEVPSARPRDDPASPVVDDARCLTGPVDDRPPTDGAAQSTRGWDVSVCRPSLGSFGEGGFQRVGQVGRQLRVAHQVGVVVVTPYP